MLAGALGHAYLLHTFPNQTQTVAAVSADTGHVTRLDSLALFGSKGKVPVLSGFAAGPSHFCELVNLFTTATPTATEASKGAYVRCGLLPRA